MALAMSPIRAAIRVMRATEAELAAHLAMCERIAKEAKGRCLWREVPVAG